MEFDRRRRGSLYRSTGGNYYWHEPSYRRNSTRDYRGHPRSSNGNRRPRDSGDLVVYFLLFFLCLLAMNSGNLPHETGLPVDEPFPASKCETLLPECECDDYEELAGLFCQNVSDFETFTKILEDGSLFEKGTTYEITLSGTRILPREFLKGLIIYRLYIDDPQTEGLQDGAFDGVLRLRRFHVRISSITEIPDFRPIRDSLRNLYLDNSLLTLIEGDHLKNLTFLETISFVNNSIRYVAADAFQGCENLLIFDISDNLLQFLPPNLFDPWKKLKKAVLSKNRLLHVNQLFAVTHPQFIYLDYNNLTDLDSVLHPNMSLVETIQLSNNPFSKVTVNSFNGKLIKIRFLYLDHCLIQEFDVKHYADLKVLSTLDLSYNLIEKVVNQTITFGKDVELDFTGNKIKEFNAELPFNVKHVYLNKNLMTTVGRTLQFSQMAQVSLADNRIQSLDYEEFRGVHGIVMLDLQGNVISTIERATFTSIRKELVYLDLSRNKIRRLNGCIQSLSLLTSLNLTENQIEGFQRGEFQGLNELTDLYLQGNRIKTLGQEVQGLNRLKYLVISHNKIRTIKAEQLPSSLQYVYVEGNPLQCDCQLLSFLLHLNKTKNLKTDVPPCSPSNNVSSAHAARCPDNCTCFCTNNAGGHYISVDCSAIGLTQLPSLFTTANASTTAEHNSTSLVIFLPRNVEESAFFSESAPFVIQDEIGGLDFSHNNLQSLEDARLPKGTKQLFLGQNLLRQSPTSLLYSLEELNTVTLSGNPWTCDCETSGFKRWILSHSEFILDANETRCGPDEQDSSGLANRAIWTLTDIDLCPADLEAYVSIVVGVLCFFLAASGVMITWIRYEINIKVWLYAHGVTWVKERDIDRDKPFDAFISFSNKDQELVMPELIDVIQKKAPSVRLCLHYRDFLPGNLIDDNIIRAVECSKRTVLVLSRNFLESEWCMFEFKAAHVQAFKDRVHRIIIIKLGDLPNESEMPKDIQMYLKSTTYLTWGDKYFWDNLLYTLPTSSSPRPKTVDINDFKQKYPILV